MASPTINPKSITQLHMLPIRGCVIDSVYIKEEKHGISAESAFYAARNVHDPVSQKLISERPSNLEEIRALGAEIIPKGGSDTSSAPSSDLIDALKAYEDCNAEQIAEIDKVKLESNRPLSSARSSSLTYKELKAIAKGEAPITKQNARYHTSHSLLMHDIRHMQLTHNQGVMMEILNIESISDIIEKDASEVLGGLLEGEKPEHTLRRSHIVWDSVRDCLLQELREKNGAIKINYGLGYETSTRLGYNTNFISSDMLAYYLSVTEGRSKNALIVIDNTSENFKLKSIAVVSSEDHSVPYRPPTPPTLLVDELPPPLPPKQYNPLRVRRGAEPSLVKLSNYLLPPIASTSKAVLITLSAAKYTFPSEFTALPGTKLCKIFTVSEDKPFTELPVEAMVNDTDLQLNMLSKGAISQEIVRVAGDSIKEECAKLDTITHPQYGNIKCHPGQVVITSAGNLKHKNGTMKALIHTSTLNMGIDRASMTSSYDIMKQSYDSVITEVITYNVNAKHENDKIHTILVPPLGDLGNAANLTVSLSYFFKTVLQKRAYELKAGGIMVVLCCQTDSNAKSAIRIMEHTSRLI